MVKKEEVAISVKSLLKLNYKQIMTCVDFLRIPFTGCSGTVSCHIMSKSCMEVHMTEISMDMNTENIVGGLRMIRKLLLRLKIVLLLSIKFNSNQVGKLESLVSFYPSPRFQSSEDKK